MTKVWYKYNTCEYYNGINKNELKFQASWKDKSSQDTHALLWLSAQTIHEGKFQVFSIILFVLHDRVPCKPSFIFLIYHISKHLNKNTIPQRYESINDK